MERYVFIHGSSVGQSAFVPTGAPDAICNDIAAKYFQGRTLRQKESAAKKALFLDLYKSSQGIYSIYSFVNNACYGANGREGQYFAISILCKGVYVYPEALYGMLNSAYDTMFRNGKILQNAENGESRYVISQFNEQKDWLSAFLKKVEEAFDKVVAGEGKIIGTNVMAADYDSWRGYKVGLDICNSTTAYKALTETGRLYISDEYESAVATINSLRTQVQRLQAEKNEIENRHLEAKRSQKSKERDEIEELNSQIRQKDVEINSLQSENANYEATIEIVRKELGKYAKIGKSVTELQNKKTQIQSKGWKDALKWCLLVLIFFLTLLSALANFGFFRNLSPLPEKEQTGENKEGVGSLQATNVPKEATSLSIARKNVEFGAEGGTEAIKVATDGDWEAPVLNDAEWISCAKLDDSTLEIKVAPNTEADRTHTFMLKSYPLENQVTITQAGVSQVTPPVAYEIQVKDYQTGEIISSGATVVPGQKLHATVSNPSKAAEGYGWKYSNCTGNDNKRNVKEVIVTVGDDPSKPVVIAYGGLDHISNRTPFRLKLGESTIEAAK